LIVTGTASTADGREAEDTAIAAVATLIACNTGADSTGTDYDGEA
jgi:hypothetical protein